MMEVSRSVKNEAVVRAAIWVNSLIPWGRSESAHDAAADVCDAVLVAFSSSTGGLVGMVTNSFPSLCLCKLSLLLVSALCDPQLSGAFPRSAVAAEELFKKGASLRSPKRLTRSGLQDAACIICA